MEDYNKIIESLGVRFIKAKNLVLQQPFTVRNSYDVGNNLILLHKGSIFFGEEEQMVEEGELLFIPGGRSTKVTYGPMGEGRTISNDDLITNREKFFRSNNDLDLIGDAAIRIGPVVRYDEPARRRGGDERAGHFRHFDAHQACALAAHVDVECRVVQRLAEANVA